MNYGPNQFSSDSLWSYELGSKSRLADGRLPIDVPQYDVDAAVTDTVAIGADTSWVSRVDFSYRGSSYGSYQPYDYLFNPPTPNPNYHNPG